jgi:hypothetical protein
VPIVNGVETDCGQLKSKNGGRTYGWSVIRQQLLVNDIELRQVALPSTLEHPGSNVSLRAGHSIKGREIFTIAVVMLRVIQGLV